MWIGCLPSLACADRDRALDAIGAGDGPVRDGHALARQLALDRGRERRAAVAGRAGDGRHHGCHRALAADAAGHWRWLRRGDLGVRALGIGSRRHGCRLGDTHARRLGADGHRAALTVARQPSDEGVGRLASDRLRDLAA